MLRYIAMTLVAAFMLAALGCATQGTRVGRAIEQPEVVKKAVQTYTLKNGVNLIVKRTSKGSPTALQVWVSGGSATDPADKPGLAHFVEHMLFTGSMHVPKGKAEQYLESMGGEFSGHTGRDFSYMGVTLPGQGWERGLDIVYDMVAFPALTQAQVDKQKKVVALEIKEARRDTDSLLMDDLFESAYATHPYRRPAYGTVEALSGYTIDDATSYYQRTYLPSNMTVVVVGDVKTADVKTAVDNTFGKLVPAPYARPKVPEEYNQLAKREKDVDAPVKLTYMAVGWHVCAAADPDIYPMEVLGAVLGLGRGSRLYMELRERMGLVYDVDTELLPMKDPGMLVTLVRLKEDDMTRVTAEILRQMNKLKDEKVSDAELARALNSLESSRLVDSETADGQAYSLGYWYTVYGKKDPEEYVKEIRKVTPADVQRVAQKYLGEGNYTVSVIKPE